MSIKNINLTNPFQLSTNQTFNSAQLLSISFIFMYLTACGETEQLNSTVQLNSPQIKTNNITNTEPELTIQPLDIDLSSSPIDKQVFLGLTEHKEKAVPPCPFLSDKTALATVETDWILKRRQSSDKHCLWSKNIGFSIKVTIEPLAIAKPAKERAYNLDSPPVIKNQNEPGANPVTLHDTTWGNERAYAMTFEQNNQLVVIYITGMKTSVERLINTAKEVAAKLTDPGVATTEYKPNNDHSKLLNMCETWTEAEIEAIIGEPVQSTPGALDCKWETGSVENLKQIRVTIYSGKSYPWNELIERGEQIIKGIGERGLMETKRKRKNMPAHVLLNTLYQEKLVTITTTDTIANHKAVALTLSKNIDQRFK